jgi:hypothetical protein
MARVARMLFQVTLPSMGRSSSNKLIQSEPDLRREPQYQAKENVPGHNADGTGKSSMGVHEPCKSGGASGIRQGSGGKEHVSFGTNMSPEKVMSDGTSVREDIKPWTAAVECFHARKFRDKNAPSTEKHTIHKVVGAGRGKRQKTQ